MKLDGKAAQVAAGRRLHVRRLRPLGEAELPPQGPGPEQDDRDEAGRPAELHDEAGQGPVHVLQRREAVPPGQLHRQLRERGGWARACGPASTPPPRLDCGSRAARRSRRRVRVSAGPRRATRSSSETIERCTARLIAAATSPVCDADRHRDRAQAVGELLVVDGEPVARTRSSSSSRRRRLVSVFGPRRAELAPASSAAVALVVGQEREQHLAHRRAVRRQPRADVQVEVDLALARAASCGSARCRRCRRRRGSPC